MRRPNILKLIICYLAQAAAAAAAAAWELGAEGDAFPLQPMQEMYVLGRDPMSTDSPQPAYVWWEVDLATLDVPRFEAAVGALVRRHEALRLYPAPGRMARVMERALASRWTLELAEVESLQHSPTDATRAAALEGFGLGGATYPLFKITGSRAAGGAVRLLLLFDLLLCDATALSVLSAELGPSRATLSRLALCGAHS